MTLPFYVLAVLGMIALPVAAGSVTRRRLAAPWWLFCVGMAAFVASQLYHLPLNHGLTKLGVLGPVSPNEPTLLRTALILGLSAGVCESLARAVGYGLLFRLRRAAQGTRSPASL